MSCVLLIDAGNTRLKWQLRNRWQVGDDREVLAQGVALYDAADWSTSWQLPDAPSSVWAGCVAGPKVEQRIERWATAQRFGRVNFVRTAREALGLRVAYRDVSRLGVDRFLAMLGARQRSRGPVCVVDVGTAMTLDAVDGRGMHVGGLIAPGPGSMIQSLLRGTAGIDEVSRERPETLFATDTPQAVTGGACYAAAALIDRFVAAATTRFGEAPQAFITGGGRSTVHDLLDSSLIEAPYLVLDGLMTFSMAGQAPGAN